MTEQPRRKPRAFRIDDPALDDADVGFDEADAAGGGEPKAPGGGAEGQFSLPTRAEIAGGFAWGSLFVAAMFALTGLAIGVWFTRFVSGALAAGGFVGWMATSLLVLICLAGVIMIAQEVRGFLKLGRLEQLRKDADLAVQLADPKAEARVAAALDKLYAGRKDMAWQRAEFREHRQGVHDPGDLLKLADRDLLGPLDTDVKRVVLMSAKRVSLVTALSPLLIIDVLFVFFENVRMLRRIATVYGGRPGFLGGLRLGRMVLVNLIAAGGMALTDDLFGQFLGQDLLRRVSGKLGEGAFNGALTARIGVAAAEMIRPMPNIETDPVRVRTILFELFRRSPTDAANAEATDPPNPRGKTRSETRSKTGSGAPGSAPQ